MEKVWGSTHPILVTPGYELHGLSVKPWYRCSLHRHAFKSNGFAVIEGCIYIDILTSVVQDEWTFESKLIRPGDRCVVETGVYHRFRAGAMGVDMLEWYEGAPPLGEDIERLDVGGPTHEQPKSRA